MDIGGGRFPVTPCVAVTVSPTPRRPSGTGQNHRGSFFRYEFEADEEQPPVLGSP